MVQETLVQQLQDSLPDAEPSERKTSNRAGDAEVADRAKMVVLEDFDIAQTMRSEFEQKWTRWYRAYRNDPAQRKYAGRSNLAIPECYRVVEVLHARTKQTMFSSDRWFRVQPNQAEDAARSEDVEAILRWETGRTSFKRDFDDFAKQAGIFGTSFAKVFWDHDIRRRVRKTRNKIGEVSREYYQDTVTCGPRFKMLFLEDIYVPTNNVTCIQDQPFVIERCNVSEPYLRTMEEAGIYENVDDILPIETSEYEDDLSSSLRTARSNIIGSFDSGSTASQFDSVKRVEILERWGEFDLEGDGRMVECVIVIANRRVVLRVEENPFDHQRRPYVHSRYTPVPGEFYGTGIIEPIEDLWYEENDNRNQAMDFKTMALNPGWLAGAAAGVNTKTWVMRPGAVWNVGNVQQVKPIEIPQGAAYLAFQMDSIIRTNIQDATGASSLLAGTDPGRIEKATVFTGLVEEANVRLRGVVEGLQNDALTPALQMMWSLEQQFRDEAIVVRLLGKRANTFRHKAISPDEMLGDFDFMPIGSLQMGAAFTRHQNLQIALQVFGPLVQSGIIRADEFRRLIEKWYSLVVDQDAEDVFGSSDYVEVLSPDVENYLIMNGSTEVHAHPLEDQRQHLEAHNKAMQHMLAQPGLSPEGRESWVQNLMTHIGEHVRFYQPQQQMQQQQQQMAAGPNIFGDGTSGAPATQPGSPMAGGNGDMLAKQAAEQPFGVGA
jgi:hypothetical protein